MSGSGGGGGGGGGGVGRCGGMRRSPGQDCGGAAGYLEKAAGKLST